MVEQVTISEVAPALFSADSSGSGPAAATAVSVSASNAQTPVAVYQCNFMGVCSTVPIVLSANAKTIVSLFGTGIRGAGLSGVSCTVHGTSVPVEYAGPQGPFLGLDQINIDLPLALKGSGQSEVVVTAAGHKANTVLIDIQ